MAQPSHPNFKACSKILQHPIFFLPQHACFATEINVDSSAASSVFTVYLLCEIIR